MDCDLSIVVPFYNEEESVVPLCRGIANALVSCSTNFEVLLVDDGSTDATYAQALAVAEQDDRFTVIKLRSNFGQTAALYAGFTQARGRIIVSMDGDLQNDPSDVPRMVSLVDEGYDVVAGWRENRKDTYFLRKLPSRIANWLIRKIAGVQIQDNGCGLRAYRAAFIKQIALYSEMHRLLPTIVALTGAKMVELPVRHHPRRFGKSKYGLSRIYKFLLDFTSLKIIMTLFRLPLFGFGAVGLFTLLGSVVLVLVGLLDHIINPAGATLIIVGAAGLLGLLGSTLLMMGMICDLLYKTGSTRVEGLLRSEIR